MNDQETADHIRRWVKAPYGPFGWPTDACGYDQHIRFVQHRNEHFNGGDFKQFALDYANQLAPESSPVPAKTWDNDRAPDECPFLL